MASNKKNEFEKESLSHKIGTNYEMGDQQIKVPEKLSQPSGDKESKYYSKKDRDLSFEHTNERVGLSSKIGANYEMGDQQIRPHENLSGQQNTQLWGNNEGTMGKTVESYSQEKRVQLGAHENAEKIPYEKKSFSDSKY